MKIINRKKIKLTSKGNQAGAAMIETIIVFPIMLFVGLGMVHLALIYQAKTNLEYAAFMAARQASVTEMGSRPDGGDLDSLNGLDELKKTVRCRMAAYDPLPVGVQCDNGDLPLDELSKVEIRFVNPSELALSIWGDDGAGNPCVTPLTAADTCRIPNANLMLQNPTDDRGTGTGINIQNANILKLRVRYFVDTGVPFMNNHFIGETRTTRLRDLYGDTLTDDLPVGDPGFWVTTDSTMHMQTDPVVNSTNFCALNDFC